LNKIVKEERAGPLEGVQAEICHMQIQVPTSKPFAVVTVLVVDT
jgi:hypothetical protein